MCWLLLQNDESSGIGTEKSSSPDTELNPLSACSSHEEVVPKQLEVSMLTYETSQTFIELNHRPKHFEMFRNNLGLAIFVKMQVPL